MRSYSISMIKSFKDGIVEIARKDSQEIALYLPHRSVIRENAESQIVHDGSVKASNSKISLSGRLETGPPLQSKIWDILFRRRFKPIALPMDMEMAFFIISVSEKWQRLITSPLNSQQRSLTYPNFTFQYSNLCVVLITLLAKWNNQRALKIQEG